MKKTLKRTRAFVLDNWLTGLVVLACSAIAVSLLVVQLGSLVNGLSPSEFALQQRLASNQMSAESILSSPLFLPYYIALYLMQLSPFSGPTAVRSISALFGLTGALGFFYVLHKWYTFRIALFGTALFATSSWFLHGARFAGPEASYLLLPLLVASVIALQAKARSKWSMLAVMLFGLMAVYIPGIIWILLPAVILQRRTIIAAFRLQPIWFNAITYVIGLLVLAPLVLMFVYSNGTSSPTSNLLGIIGLPDSLPNILDVLRNVGNNLGDIFLRSSNGPTYSPGNLPWFDVGTSVLVLLGAVQFARYYKLDRSKLIVIVGLFGLLLSSLGGPVSLLVLLPFLYFLAVEGLKWLLERWLEIFPRNPFARSFGVTVIVIVVASISTYQLNKYFLAWGKAPETQAVYNIVP